MPDCPGALHSSDMHDGNMIRLRLPGGVLTSSQLSFLADLSHNQGNGLLDLTNRANLQIRGLNKISTEQLETSLIKQNLLAKEFWADRLRNIMACPLSGFIGNALDYSNMVIVHQLDNLLQQTPILKNLSPKFSFIIDNGSAFHIGKQSHDIAMRAYKVPTPKDALKAIKFRLSIAGQNLGLSVQPDQVAQFMVEIAEFICHFKDDKPPAQTIKRGADLLNHLGSEALTKAIQTLAPYATPCDPDLHEATPRRQPPIGIIPHQFEKAITLGLRVPVSRLNAKQLHTLSDLSSSKKRSDADYINLSPWQTIYIPRIPQQYAEESLQIAQENGFITDQNFQNTHVYACSGGTGCPRTKAKCKEDGLVLTQKLLSYMKKQKTPSNTPLTIHLSGCKRGCGFAGKADFLALAQTDGSGYQLYENKSLFDIRQQPDDNQRPLHTDIVQTIISKVKNRHS